MHNLISDKISILNQVTLESFDFSSETEIVGKFAESGIKILGADFGFVWFKERDKKNFELIYTSRNIPYLPNRPRKKGTNYRVQHKKDPLFIHDVVRANFVRSDAKKFMKSAAVIPITYQDRTYGNVVICFKKPRRFTNEDRSLGAFLGNSLAQAITIHRLYSSLKHQAYHDPLTALPNRTSFKERVLEAREFIKRNKKFAILFCDLDSFKFINDMFGHNEGDKLLALAGDRLRRTLQEDDSIFRMGGDEFMIILQNIKNEGEGVNAAKNLQRIFKKPFIIGGQEIYVNLSTGISLFPDDGSDIKTLLRKADRALHQVKDIGGDGYQQFNPQVLQAEGPFSAIDKELRHALKKNELVLHYQPITRLIDGKIIAAEALVRWNHPKLGLISPDTFLSRAEDSGLIVQIGEWVMNESYRQSRVWQKAKLPFVPISVNLSPRQLVNQNLLKFVSQIVKKRRSSGPFLAIEITETAIINMEHAQRVLKQFKKMGMNISIDDFGTGYASLNRLRKLPVDTIKIDKTFIQASLTSKADAAIIKAIISFAHELKMDVVAEGVDKKSQLSFLRPLECDYVQGNLLNPPVPAKEFGRILKKGRVDQVVKL